MPHMNIKSVFGKGLTLNPVVYERNTIFSIDQV